MNALTVLMLIDFEGPEPILASLDIMSYRVCKLPVIQQTVLPIRPRPNLSMPERIPHRLSIKKRFSQLEQNIF